jgi:hypothetical protein
MGVEPDSPSGSSRGVVISTNPAGCRVRLMGTGFRPEAVLRIYDLAGREMLGVPFDGSFTLEGSSLPFGCYVVEVTDGRGEPCTARLVLLDR